MTNLIKFNPDGYIRTNICNFIVEFIDRIFFQFNTEHLQINNDIRKFTYIIKSVGFLREVEEQTKTEGQPEGIYEEYVDEEVTDEDVEKRIDEEEEFDARDIDMDPEDVEENAASAYDQFIDFEGSY